MNPIPKKPATRRYRITLEVVDMTRPFCPKWALKAAIRQGLFNASTMPVRCSIRIKRLKEKAK